MKRLPPPWSLQWCGNGELASPDRQDLLVGLCQDWIPSGLGTVRCGEVYSACPPKVPAILTISHR